MVGDPVSRVVYTATATTTTNTRITYELGTGGNAMMFNINDNTGEVRYNASPTVVSTGFEVIITATDEDDNSANITITVTVNKGDQPDFGFAAPTVRKIPGDANFTVTASGGSGTGTVTYASGDDAIATVDTASGEVTIVAVGITTITATKATDDDYNEATASYVLSVLPVSPRLSAVSRTILPEVARAITDTTVNAITQRLEQAGADSHQPDAFTLAGQSTLTDILTTGGQSLATGTLNLHDILGRSAFVMPLNPVGGLVEGLTLWGGGEYREFGGSGGAVDWDGALFSARLGADARVSDTLLAGAALSWTDGDFEYGELTDEPTSGGGDYTLEMTSIAPYVGWSVLPGGRLNLWATAGYGWGEVAITDTVAQNAETIEDTQTSDATLKLAGGGVSARVLESNLGHVRLKGEVMQTSMELEGRDFIEALTVEARRARFSVAAGRTYTSADGARLTPTVEVGLRHDAGDGRTGTGAEVGGELSYTDPYNWLTLDTQGRVLLGHNGGYDDWGIGAIFTLKPTPGGQGLALRLTPTYGQTVTNTAQLWDQSAAALTGTDAAALGQRMNAEVGYGLAMADGQSLLTPYGNMTWGQRTRAYRLGSRLTLASGLNLSLESRRGETPGVAVDHGVRLNVEWGW